MNFDNYKFHPSSLGKIMTPAKTKGDDFGETCKEHLLECWIEATYGRRKEFSSKYTEKGTLVEEDSITLYSIVTGKFHKKNTETIVNDFFVGTPDLFDGPDIHHATVIKDIKSSWDIFTFHATMAKPMNKMYIWQLLAYMDLTGATESGLVYCLVDTPEHIINDAKRKLQWNMGVSDPTALHNTEFLRQCDQIDFNMKFSDIPKEKRYIEFVMKRNQEMINDAHDQVIKCRQFLNSLNK